jgi:hypothetical protein
MSPAHDDTPRVIDLIVDRHGWTSKRAPKKIWSRPAGGKQADEEVAPPASHKSNTEQAMVSTAAKRVTAS